MKKVKFEVNEDELTYLLSVGFAAVRFVPEKALPTYTHFSKDQIMEFSKKIRNIMNENGLDI